MNDPILNLIRRAINRGLGNDDIRDLLSAYYAIIDEPQDVAPAEIVPAPRRSVQPRNAIQRPARPNGFVKPDQTRTLYRLGASLRRSRNLTSTLDNMGIGAGTNNRAVLEYLAAQPNHAADTRQMRGAILTHALKPNGTNKALESALHGLSTREPALVERLDKPEADD